MNVLLASLKTLVKLEEGYENGVLLKARKRLATASEVTIKGGRTAMFIFFFFSAGGVLATRLMASI